MCSSDLIFIECFLTKIDQLRNFSPFDPCKCRCSLLQDNDPPPWYFQGEDVTMPFYDRAGNLLTGHGLNSRVLPHIFQLQDRSPPYYNIIPARILSISFSSVRGTDASPRRIFFSRRFHVSSDAPKSRICASGFCSSYEEIGRASCRERV